MRDISQERITAELLATLRVADIKAVLLAMQACGVLAVILPEMSAALPLVETERASAINADYRWLARLALLLRELTATQLTATLQRLKLPNQQQLLVQRLLLYVPQIEKLAQRRATMMALLDTIEHNVPPQAFRQIFYPIWQQRDLSEAFANNLAALYDCETQFADLRCRALPVSGTDIMRVLHLKPSPMVGDLLQQLQTSYREGEWQTRAEGLELIKQLHGK